MSDMKNKGRLVKKETDPGLIAMRVRQLILWATIKDMMEIFYFFMYMSVLPVQMSVYHVCAWYPQRPEESIKSLEL